MSDFIEILKLAKQLGASIVSRRNDSAEEIWNQVEAALEKLSELTTLHVEAIQKVTRPLLQNDDLEETARRYSLLANNPGFPQGYGAFRGVIDGAKQTKVFEEEAIQQQLTCLLDELYNFQYGTFFLEWDSYRVADAFSRASDLVQPSSECSTSDFRELGGIFIECYTSLLKQPDDPALDAPTSAGGLSQLLQYWCQSWQRHIQRTLYGGRGLDYHTSKLKMLKQG